MTARKRRIYDSDNGSEDTEGVEEVEGTEEVSLVRTHRHGNEEAKEGGDRNDDREGGIEKSEVMFI